MDQREADTAQSRSQSNNKSVMSPFRSLWRLIRTTKESKLNLQFTWNEHKAHMKKTIKLSKPRKNGGDELRTEYQFDYKKARPNRFARRDEKTPLIVVLDPDMAKVFSTSESVNHALRTILAAFPK